MCESQPPPLPFGTLACTGAAEFTQDCLRKEPPRKHQAYRPGRKAKACKRVCRSGTAREKTEVKCKGKEMVRTPLEGMGGGEKRDWMGRRGGGGAPWPHTDPRFFLPTGSCLKLSRSLSLAGGSLLLSRGRTASATSGPVSSPTALRLTVRRPPATSSQGPTHSQRVPPPRIACPCSAAVAWNSAR